MSYEKPILGSWEADAKMLHSLYSSGQEAEGWDGSDLGIERDMLLGYGASDDATEEEVRELKETKA